MAPFLPILVVLGLVAVSTALGFLWKSQNGRVHHSNGQRVISQRELPKAQRLGSGATLLQFSTEVCAPCRTTHTVLDSLASESKDISHIDLDLTHRPDLARQFNIMQTPTTLILDGKGVVRARIGGAVRRDTVRAELDRILIAA